MRDVATFGVSLAFLFYFCPFCRELFLSNKKESRLLRFSRQSPVFSVWIFLDIDFVILSFLFHERVVELVKRYAGGAANFRYILSERSMF